MPNFARTIRPPFILVTAAITLTALGCHSQPVANQSSLESKRSDGFALKCSASKQLPEIVRGNIHSTVPSAWRATARRIDGGEDIGSIQLLDGSVGWVGGHKLSLYTTVNSGREWRKITLKGLPEGTVRSISFVSPTLGWIVVSTVVSPFEEGGRDATKSWILATTDGGATWQTQYQNKAIRIDQVAFVNDREGWAIGDRIVEYQ
jgi:photosystem II stability/assembly factor-like uncharacterized protein